MSALDFPSTGPGGRPLQNGDQYVGDNGVTYIYDGVKWIGHSSVLPPGTSALLNTGHIFQIDATGNLVAPNYVFPATSGTASQVLVWPNSGNTLVWQNQSGTGGGSSAPSWFITSATSTLTMSSGVVGVSPYTSIVFDREIIGDQNGAALGSGQYEQSEFTTTFFVSPMDPMLLGGAGVQIVDYTSLFDNGNRPNYNAAAIFVGNTSATGGVDGLQDVNTDHGSVRIQSYNTSTFTANTWTFAVDGSLTFPQYADGNPPTAVQYFGMGNLFAETDGIYTVIGTADPATGNANYAGIGIMPGIESQTGVYIPNDAHAGTSPVWISNNNTAGQVQIEVNQKSWYFNSNGSLTLPGSNPESIYGGPGIIDFTPDSSLRIGTPTLTGSGFRDHNIRHAIAIGNGAQDWNVNTGSYSIVIGSGDDTGYGAKDKSVVIGSGAGFNDGGAVGTASIAIGYRANYDHGADHTITLNATGNDLSVDHSGFFVKPIRQDGASRAKAVFYNTATGELTYTTSTVYQLTSGTAVLSVASDSSVTLPNGAKLDGGVSYKFATDNSVTQYIDLRDASGRGFYTDGSGYTLRSSSSYSWIFGLDGSLRAPALPVNGASFDIVYTQPTLMLGVNSSDSTIADTPSDETNRGNRTILIQGQRGYGSFSTNGPGGKGTSVRIQGGLGGESSTTNGGGEGGTINVYGGDGNGGNGGGWVNIVGGGVAYNYIGSNPYGGQVNITGGSALGAYSGTGIGGDIILQGGRGNFANGRVSIQTFDSLLSTWNNWNFNQDGTLNIQGDIQDSNGSVIRIATTSTAPTRVNGQLWFNTDEGRTYIKYNGQWVDASPTEVPPVSTYLGDITVIGNTLYINTSTLTIDDSGTLLVNGAQVTGTGGGGGGGFITSGTLFGPQIVGFVPPDSALIFSSTASNSNLAELGFVAPGGFGSNNDFISVLGAANLGGSTASSVMIFSAAASGNQSQWKFGGDGVLTLSTASTILGTGSDPNVYIETVTSSTTSIWTFGTNGVLTLPASTPVIKGAGSGTDVTIVATTGSNTSTWVFGADGKLTLPVAGAQIASDVTFLGNVTFSNSATYVVSTNTVYTDSLVEIHAPSGGVGGSWASNDGNDIGFRFHYYDGADKNAALFMDNGTWRLKWAVDGTETGGQFNHSGLGDIEARVLYAQSMRSGSYDGNQLNLTTGSGAQLASLRDGAVYIQVGTDGTAQQGWSFSSYGIGFPDASIQTTAWTGTIAYSSITGAPSSSSFPAGIVFDTTQLDSTGTSTYSLFNSPTTLNIANGSSTGTVNIASGPTVSGSTVNLNLGTNGLAGSITNVNIGSQISGATSVITAYGIFRGYQVQEKFTTLTPANASTATLDCSSGNIFNINMGTLGQNWTPWLTNLNLPQNYITTISIIVNQTGTAYIPTSVVIPGATNTSFTWQGGSTPTGSANKKDVIAYNIYSTATNYYTVLAQLVSF